MTIKDKQTLLEEYKVCDSTVNRLDNLIWQMASILFPITLAGLAYFGLAASHTLDQFVVLVVVAIGSIILTLNWYFLSRQWAGYQKIAVYRMREIEHEIGNVWLYRYSGFTRLDAKSRINIISKTDNDEERERLEKINSFFRGFPFYGLFRSMTVLTILFVFAWLILIAREVYIIFF